MIKGVISRHREVLLYTAEPRKEVLGVSQREAWLGEEAEEPSLTWGMGPDDTKPHSLLLHVENGRRARGGGEADQKKLGGGEEGGGGSDN